jgi:tetratricopeptide (TPR) repeat protein
VIEDQERLAPRLLAFAGLWFLLSGLLLVLSFVVVALVAFVAMFSVLIAIGGVFAARRLRLEDRLWTPLASATDAGQRVGRRLRSLGVPRRVRGLGIQVGKTAAGTAGRAKAFLGRVGRRLRSLGVQRRVRGLGIQVGKTAARTPGHANAFLARALQTYAIAVYRLRIHAAHLLYAGRRSQAFRLNELGTQLRRRGAPQQAAEQHRVALEIARDLGDDQAKALTLNSLALALAQDGAEAEAVAHFEQARVVLRELGDEKHEAQVIANLGIVYRRQGNSEEAVSLLHEALDKLPPGSWAYRQVEEELHRAS